MRKVMLVEDEDFILQGLENIIDWEELGLSIVHRAHNGMEALELYQKENVDIIVTDVSMPLMDGLELLKNVRSTDPVARFIILTGYSEFEYARAALRLDVEDYILKPINEEELVKSLENCKMRLEKMEEEKNARINEKVELLQFLEGSMEAEKRSSYLEEMGVDLNAQIAYAAIVRARLPLPEGYRVTDICRCIEEKKIQGALHLWHLRDSSILLLYFPPVKMEMPGEWFANLQNELEIELGVDTFITISDCFEQPLRLPEVYRRIEKMQKYLLVDGYGSCMEEQQLANRTSADVAIDQEKLSRFILKKDVAAAGQYVEDLFINNMQKDVSVEVLYQIAVRIALTLNEIRQEYKLEGESMPLLDVMERIWQAEDIFSIRAVFLSEITEIVSLLNMENSQYTPVVRQIMAEVKNNYQSDMNLKTLAYKYHMNTSYLGQIFQKEVGCPFSQYLNNVRNSVAKQLILNTNMRINDVAEKVGYSDTSYFYRKFKQSYGVSPAALRDMKNY